MYCAHLPLLLTKYKTTHLFWQSEIYNSIPLPYVTLGGASTLELSSTEGRTYFMTKLSQLANHACREQNNGTKWKAKTYFHLFVLHLDQCRQATSAPEIRRLGSGSKAGMFKTRNYRNQPPKCSNPPAAAFVTTLLL